MNKCIVVFAAHTADFVLSDGVHPLKTKCGTRRWRHTRQVRATGLSCAGRDCDDER